MKPIPHDRMGDAVRGMVTNGLAEYEIVGFITEPAVVLRSLDGARETAVVMSSPRWAQFRPSRPPLWMFHGERED